MTRIADTLRGWPAFLAGLLAAAVAAAPAHATAVSDPAGDFLPTFTGTRSGDLDVLSFGATFDGSTFHLSATLNGPVGTLPSSLYVIGFNRGAGTSNFAAIGLPGVTFDAVVTVTGAGVTGGRDLVSNTALTLPAGAFGASGNSFTLNVPAALLPSEGLPQAAYLVNLWPRDSVAPGGGNAQISDFAPNATDLPVPEPATMALLAAPLLALAVLRRRRGTRPHDPG